MYVIEADDVNEAFGDGLRLMLRNGEASPSRNGEVLRLPVPVTTIYNHPQNRVLWNPVRRPNPFFHLMEAMWMLAGRNDLRFISMFNKRMSEYSDDGGVTQPAAYGYRWREYFGYDQLEWILLELGGNPSSRRCVLQMWHAGDKGSETPGGDLYAATHGSKDVPCNTTIYFLIRDSGELDMTVSCRSNDLMWGCYGANVVHMSILHEYMAARLGVPLGKYYQISNDLHVYTEIYSVETMHNMLRAHKVRFYHEPAPLPLVQFNEKVEDFDYDLRTFFAVYDAVTNLNEGEFIIALRKCEWKTLWFRGLVLPMLCAWCFYKRKDHKWSDTSMNDVVCQLWHGAAVRWLEIAKRSKS